MAGADGVERRERRVHERAVETVFGTVDAGRAGCARPGHESLHPLDASLNLPVERYSLEVRRRVAEAAASRSFDEALMDLSRHTGAKVPKRQAEQLAVRAAEDFDAFYEARRAAAGEPVPAESVVVLTFDGKGVVLHREDLREATRKAAERRRRQRRQRPSAPARRQSSTGIRTRGQEHVESHLSACRRSSRPSLRAATQSIRAFTKSIEDCAKSRKPQEFRKRLTS